MDLHIQKKLERLSDLQTRQSVEYKKWLSEKLNGKSSQLDFAYSLSSDTQHISEDTDEKFRALLNAVFLKFDRKLMKDKKILNRPINERTQYIFFPENQVECLNFFFEKLHFGEDFLFKVTSKQLK